MEEAIAAIATGGVRAAIGIVRLSGAGCVEAVERIFTPAGGGTLTARAPRTLAYGALRDRDGQVIDQVLATYSRAPHSYTGEDAAELHCHGSPTVLALALESLVHQGVRPAQAGEFTRRAFLNGKLDLAEAEGVADLIDAQSPAAARCAAGQLTGALSRRVAPIYDGLVDLLAHFHATVDYPDEDLAPLDQAGARRSLQALLAQLTELAGTYRRGRAITQGVPCAIVGPPNAGKSSLLNALVGYDRAIVTDVPGTTRDTVEERCNLGDVLLRLIDTAGLRDAGDQVERLGVERSRRAMEEAGLILVVLDGSQPPEAQEDALVREARGRAPTIVLLNKSDLPTRRHPGALAPTLSISAKTGAGLSELEEQVARLFPQPSQEELGQVLTNARQYAAATQAQAALERALAALENGLPAEMCLLDAEAAAAALGALTGKEVRADVVDRVFARFCVGK